ncbi:hypothetical protein [Paenibacillus catalpae]|uniref:hypothetical protein n=1 Tax=Paenibacillus catalpae TaxID=1045775 RepID=UPI000B8747BF|nr:hypothetical protein [Paenibacillus catalpae]
MLPPNDENKTLTEGAATIVWCATGSKLNDKGGVYCDGMDIASVTETRFASGVFSYAIDPDNAIRLWNVSVELTGVRFAI